MMEAKIIHQSDENLIIGWNKENIGQGQLIFHQKGGKIEIDAEYMGLNHIVEVFNALK